MTEKVASIVIITVSLLVILAAGTAIGILIWLS